MKSDIKFPVIVDECGNPPTSHDVFLCYSMGDLSYMEPIDIQNGEYQLLDADGYIVSPHIGGTIEHSVPLLRWVGIKLIDSSIPVSFTRKMPLSMDKRGARAALLDMLLSKNSLNYSRDILTRLSLSDLLNAACSSNG